jgi:hypothetical protein
MWLSKAVLMHDFILHMQDATNELDKGKQINKRSIQL